MVTSVPIQFWAFILTALCMVGLYFLFWYIKYRRKGDVSVVPREEPPRDISPAAARYIYKCGFDSDCLLAGILNATVKNCYRINWRDDSFSIALANHSLTHTLSKDEQAALSYNPAFFIKRLGVSKRKTKFTDKAEDRMQKVLKEKYGQLIVNKDLLTAIGVVLSGLLLLLGTFLFARPLIMEMGRYALLYLPLVFAGISLFRYGLQQQNWGIIPLGVGQVIFGLMGIIEVEMATDFLLSSAILPFALVGFIGHRFIPNYTPDGFRLLIEIKEFKLFLENRISSSNILAEDEAYLLPYLIAFNIDFNKSHYFDPLLTTYKVHFKYFRWI